ncbi:MAG: hypothetical protein ABEJ95_00970 [Candidatus Nanohalobium sp.]
MPETVKVAEDVRREAEKTIEALKSVGSGEGKNWSDIKDKYLD